MGLMKKHYFLPAVITLVAISLSAADKDFLPLKRVSPRNEGGPKKSSSFLSLVKSASSNALSSKIGDSPLIELRRKMDQQPRGYIARKKDDGNEMPHCYIVFNEQKHEIAQVNVHNEQYSETKNPLWIKLSNSGADTLAKIKEILPLWKNNYALDKQVIKSELVRTFPAK